MSPRVRYTLEEALRRLESFIPGDVLDDALLIDSVIGLIQETNKSVTVAVPTLCVFPVLYLLFEEEGGEGFTSCHGAFQTEQEAKDARKTEQAWHIAKLVDGDLVLISYWTGAEWMVIANLHRCAVLMICCECGAASAGTNQKANSGIHYLCPRCIHLKQTEGSE